MAFRKGLNDALHATRAGSAGISWGTHDLRRGAAQEIVRRGGTLADVLGAGGWRSPAFRRYLDNQDVCDQAVTNVLLAPEASDSEDDRPRPGGP